MPNVLNWHKRNANAAALKPVQVACWASCSETKRYFQIRVRDPDGRLMTVTFTPEEALQFARDVEHCTRRVRGE
jgi:hypothetical protein